MKYLKVDNNIYLCLLYLVYQLQFADVNEKYLYHVRWGQTFQNKR